MRKSRAITLVAALLWMPVSVLADTGVTSMQVSVTVLPYCKVTTAQDVNFGPYSAVTGNTATGKLSVRCSIGSKYSVALNNGNGMGATPAARRMTLDGGTGTLSYGLYQDSAFAIPWGSNLGSNTFSGTGSGVQQTLTVHGRLPPGQNVAPGSYSDTVTVTVSLDGVQ